MVTQKHPPGPPMTLGNMRELGVQHLIAFCLNDACRHQALIDVSSLSGPSPRWPPETIKPATVHRSRIQYSEITSAFGATADMTAPGASLVPVANAE